MNPKNNPTNHNFIKQDIQDNRFFQNNLKQIPFKQINANILNQNNEIQPINSIYNNSHQNSLFNCQEQNYKNNNKFANREKNTNYFPNEYLNIDNNFKHSKSNFEKIDKNFNASNRKYKENLNGEFKTNSSLNIDNNSLINNSKKFSNNIFPNKPDKTQQIDERSDLDRFNFNNYTNYNSNFQIYIKEEIYSNNHPNNLNKNLIKIQQENLNQILSCRNNSKNINLNIMSKEIIETLICLLKNYKKKKDYEYDIIDICKKDEFIIFFSRDIKIFYAINTEKVEASKFSVLWPDCLKQKSFHIDYQFFYSILRESKTNQINLLVNLENSEDGSIEIKSDKQREIIIGTRSDDLNFPFPFFNRTRDRLEKFINEPLARFHEKFLNHEHVRKLLKEKNLKLFFNKELLVIRNTRANHEEGLFYFDPKEYLDFINENRIYECLEILQKKRKNYLECYFQKTLNKNNFDVNDWVLEVDLKDYILSDFKMEKGKDYICLDFQWEDLIKNFKAKICLFKVKKFSGEISQVFYSQAIGTFQFGDKIINSIKGNIDFVEKKITYIMKINKEPKDYDIMFYQYMRDALSWNQLKQHYAIFDKKYKDAKNSNINIVSETITQDILNNKKVNINFNNNLNNDKSVNNFPIKNTNNITQNLENKNANYTFNREPKENFIFPQKQNNYNLNNKVDISNEHQINSGEKEMLLEEKKTQVLENFNNKLMSIGSLYNLSDQNKNYDNTHNNSNIFLGHEKSKNIYYQPLNKGDIDIHKNQVNSVFSKSFNPTNKTNNNQKQSLICSFQNQNKSNLSNNNYYENQANNTSNNYNMSNSLINKDTDPFQRRFSKNNSECQNNIDNKDQNNNFTNINNISPNVNFNNQKVSFLPMNNKNTNIHDKMLINTLNNNNLLQQNKENIVCSKFQSTNDKVIFANSKHIQNNLQGFSALYENPSTNNFLLNEISINTINTNNSMNLKEERKLKESNISNQILDFSLTEKNKCSQLNLYKNDKTSTESSFKENIGNISVIDRTIISGFINLESEFNKELGNKLNFIPDKHSINNLNKNEEKINLDNKSNNKILPIYEFENQKNLNTRDINNNKISLITYPVEEREDENELSDLNFYDKKSIYKIKEEKINLKVNDNFIKNIITNKLKLNEDNNSIILGKGSKLIKRYNPDEHANEKAIEEEKEKDIKRCFMKNNQIKKIDQINNFNLDSSKFTSNLNEFLNKNFIGEKNTMTSMDSVEDSFNNKASQFIHQENKCSNKNNLLKNNYNEYKNENINNYDIDKNVGCLNNNLKIISSINKVNNFPMIKKDENDLQKNRDSNKKLRDCKINQYYNPIKEEQNIKKENKNCDIKKENKANKKENGDDNNLIKENLNGNANEKILKKSIEKEKVIYNQKYLDLMVQEENVANDESITKYTGKNKKKKNSNNDLQKNRKKKKSDSRSKSNKKKIIRDCSYEDEIDISRNEEKYNIQDVNKKPNKNKNKKTAKE